MSADSDFENRYPAVQKLYGKSMLALKMGFIKRMRRHRSYPLSGYFAPVFNLNFDIIAGYKFSENSDKSVNVEKYDPVDKSVNLIMTKNGISDAWIFYCEEIKRVLETK